jgi:hypothetical protein
LTGNTILVKAVRNAKRVGTLNSQPTTTGIVAIITRSPLVSNSFDTEGNQHFTRFAEWEAAVRRRGLQGPVDSDAGKHYINSAGEVKATWTSAGGQAHGVILK